MTGAYYNEFDPFAAAWLRELIKEGLIADGEVDTRSILDVRPADLRGFRQCHFFAGIGGWSRALRLAGRKDDQPGWTASLPCQPLSCAGDQRGHADERHLWPTFHDLVAECRPPEIFGEQVASRDGREWFAGVRLDLEDMGYACGAADLCAAGVGAPHIRQRLFWVAYAQDADQRPGKRGTQAGIGPQGIGRQRSTGGGADDRLGDAQDPGLSQRERDAGDAGENHGAPARQGFEQASGLGDSLAHPAGGGSARKRRSRQAGVAEHRPFSQGLDDAPGARRLGAGERPEAEARDEARLRGSERGCGEGLGLGDAQSGGRGVLGNAAFPRNSGHPDGPIAHPWRSVLIPCADGKWRRIAADQTGQPEPSLFPLAYGVPNRMGTLRGAGNAINPYIAAEFIKAAEGALT